MNVASMTATAMSQGLDTPTLGAGPFGFGCAGAAMLFQWTAVVTPHHFNGGLLKMPAVPRRFQEIA